MKLIPFEGREYIDDRIFVLEICKALPSVPPKPNELLFTLVTRRNVLGYPPTRSDDFATWEEAAEYLKHVEPETPRISLGGKSPSPVPTYEEHVKWLTEQGLTSCLSSRYVF